MQLEYSSNHAHITGDFAEHLLLYWLSKKGYECVHASQIGIDIIASKDGKRMGISVKSRSRKEGKSDYGITMNNPTKHIEKIRKTCESFNCEEYFAFVIDQMGVIRVILTPLKVVEECYRISEKSSQDWNIRRFEADIRTKIFELKW